MSASDIVIRRVIVNPPGPDEQGEVVQIHNAGQEDVDLSGWTLSDQTAHPGATYRYTIPAFTLAAGFSVAVHTGVGTDDDSHLYWGRDTAVWNNDQDRAVLADASGSEIHHLDWTSPPRWGRVVETGEIAREIADAGSVDGVEAPTSPVRWTWSQRIGGEVFWREYGEGGAAFHVGYPDSLPDGLATPQDRVTPVFGEIYRRFADRGGAEQLGRPLAPEQPVLLADPERFARSQRFDGGTIYWSPETAAHLVIDEVRQRWLEKDAGGPSGEMGLPIAELRQDPAGVRYQDFERGSIWLMPDGSVELFMGIKIEFSGFHCFGEQQGPGSDEPYFHVTVAPQDPPTDAPTAIDDGQWLTTVPFGVPSFTGINDHSSQVWKQIVFIGRPAPVRISTFLLEHDSGDQNAFRQEIQVAVAAAGAVTSALIPAASVVAMNPAVQSAVATAINHLVDSGDDLIGVGQNEIATRAQILQLLNTPPAPSGNGYDAHLTTPLLTDGDASYGASFIVSRWDPSA